MPQSSGRSNGVNGKQLVTPTQARETYEAELATMTPLVLGFPELNRLTRPASGQLFVLGGRPGMYKTTLALNMATNLAMQRKLVCWLGLESSPGALSTQMLARLSTVPLHRLIDSRVRGGKALDILDAGLVAEGSKKLRDEIDPYFSFHAAGRPLAEVRETALGTKYHAIFVDHLGLVGRGSGNKFDVIELALTFFRALSMGHITPSYRPFVCILSQLNREGEREAARTTGTFIPRLDHLWGSGFIEADADTAVIMYGKHDLPDKTCTVKGIVRKNRQGPEPITLDYWADPLRYDMRELASEVVQPAQHPATFVQQTEGAEA
jgi:replicative DNA helicase